MFLFTTMQAAKLFFAAIVAFSLLAEFAESNEAAKYYDQVIYIESLQFRSYYLDAHHSKNALFTKSPQTTLTGHIWFKWIVRRGPGGTVALESVRYPKHYLDATHYKACRITPTSNPNGVVWALWYMEKSSDGTIQLRSKRYPDSRVGAFLINRYIWARIKPGSGSWSKLRIYQPTANEAEEYYNQVIYIESLQFHFHYLDVHHSKNALFTKSSQTILTGQSWFKWIVRRGPGGTVALESVRYPKHYLDATHYKVCRVTPTSNPNGVVWALWYMEKSSDGTIQLRSKRYPDSRVGALLINRYIWARINPGSGIWSKLRIYQPKQQ